MRSFVRALTRGLALRCPACGEGRMSPAWWSVTRLLDECTQCGTTFHPGRGEWTGALMFAQGFYFAVSLFGLFVSLLATGPPPLPRLLAWLFVSAGVFPLCTYRNLKAAWVGTMYGLSPWAEGTRASGNAQDVP